MGVASREHSTVAVKLPPKGKGAPLTVREPAAQGRAAGLGRCRLQAAPWRAFAPKPAQRRQHPHCLCRRMPGPGLALPLAMLDHRRDQVQDPDVQRHPLPVAKRQRWGWAWRSGKSGRLNHRSMWKPPLSTDDRVRPADGRLRSDRSVNAADSISTLRSQPIYRNGGSLLAQTLETLSANLCPVRATLPSVLRND